VSEVSIIVHPDFDQIWPFTADHLHELLLEKYTNVEFIRLPRDSQLLLSEAFPQPGQIIRLVSLGVPVTEQCLDLFTSLQEAFIGIGRYAEKPIPSLTDALAGRGVHVIAFSSVGYWGQSVAEFALGLTIAALRRIPQTHREMMTSHDTWQYPQEQFGDNPSFANGTIEGKKVRIVGAGNIASRYAKFVHMLGADVAVWDPYAGDPAFHLAGSRREWHLDRLLRDADIFLPMVPLTPHTVGLIKKEHIQALPNGCLVVMVTRAEICDMAELRGRVLADELSLAADVFDKEPLPLNDALLGRHNVVHTPHNAGRTKEANLQWAEMLASQFR